MGAKKQMDEVVVLEVDGEVEEVVELEEVE